MVQNIGDQRADTVLLAGQAVDRATVQGLKSASTKSGVSFQYLLAKAAQESSLNTNAQADSSSASGLFQFTKGTWLDMVKRFGAQYGYGDLSRQILETPSGKLTVTDQAAEQRILALRQDPEASGLMAAEYARDNAASLKDALGRDADTAELYLAHFLGASGAKAMLTSADETPSRTAASVLPGAAKANPSIFTAADGHARSVTDVLKLIRDRFSGQMQRYADAGDGATISDATPATAAAKLPTAPANPAGSVVGKLDLKAALGGVDSRTSPATIMMLDQLLRMIASDPMSPAVQDEEPSDGVRPLSSGSLKGSDWADAMSKVMASHRPATARRAYAAGDTKPLALDDQI